MSKSGSAAAIGDVVVARAYVSPTLVLFAMDWPGGVSRPDFLGFAILRSPGFAKGEQDGYLVNKVSFSAPSETSQPLPSNLAPFQKFLWWDSAIDDVDRGKTFSYIITPVCGTGPSDLVLQHHQEASIQVVLPNFLDDGVWTCFNRAVVSSQAFRREFPEPEKDLDRCMKWLANGLDEAFPTIMAGSTEVLGAIYHLTDNEWVVPSLTRFAGDLSLVYESQPKKDATDLPAIKILEKNKKFKGYPRSKTHIMHDKFLVDQTGARVLMGSANFTPEGLTSQANLLHIFRSRELADLYSERAALLQEDPTIAETAANAGWSNPVSVGAARIRVFFSPEPKGERVAIDTVIQAVQAAKSSVVFCMFSPTDAALLDALMAVGDNGKLLYGLLNSISDPTLGHADDNSVVAPDEGSSNLTDAAKIKVEIYNRSRQNKKTISYDYFRPGTAPTGFLPEFSTVDLSSRSTLASQKPGQDQRPPPAVHIHHKFIVIDAETDTPTIFTGSANMSKNSSNFNDENLLEITKSPRLAQLYFAEFMRLYEHYRARALWDWSHQAGAPGKEGANTFILKSNRDGWVKQAYIAGTPEFLARTRLAR